MNDYLQDILNDVPNEENSVNGRNDQNAVPMNPQPQLVAGAMRPVILNGAMKSRSKIQPMNTNSLQQNSSNGINLFQNAVNVIPSSPVGNAMNQFSNQNLQRERAFTDPPNINNSVPTIDRRQRGSSFPSVPNAVVGYSQVNQPTPNSIFPNRSFNSIQRPGMNTSNSSVPDPVFPNRSANSVVRPEFNSSGVLGFTGSLGLNRQVINSNPSVPNAVFYNANGASPSMNFNNSTLNSVQSNGFQSFPNIVQGASGMFSYNSASTVNVNPAHPNILFPNRSGQNISRPMFQQGSLPSNSFIQNNNIGSMGSQIQNFPSINPPAYSLMEDGGASPSSQSNQIIPSNNIFSLPNINDSVMPQINNPVFITVDVISLIPDGMPNPVSKHVIENIIKDEPIVIGRKGVNNPSVNFIPLRSFVVSKNHAEIFKSAGVFYIKDNGSTTGTFLNAMRLSPEKEVSRPFTIKTSDAIQFGVDDQSKPDDPHSRSISFRIKITKKKIVKPE